MKYLCAIYYDEKQLDAVPKAAADAIEAECRVYDAALKEKGRLLACERLQPVATATTVRHQGGTVTVTDGPFAETKEQLGGFYLIEARDLDEAIRIASRIPPGRLGCVEVRPVLEPGR
ncbi:MAG TPA: YciI family protein [Gemmatimonadales bacterium]|nr:YciI family protein [Gemmatimonadales bacterium]